MTAANDGVMTSINSATLATVCGGEAAHAAIDISLGRCDGTAMSFGPFGVTNTGNVPVHVTISSCLGDKRKSSPPITLEPAEK